MRLHLGCGDQLPPGWTNVDRTHQGQECVANVVYGLPFDNETFECAVANHVLQQINVHDLDAALKELHRVLIVGGTLRVMVPDIVGAFQAYLGGDEAWFPNQGESIDEKFTTYLTWYGTNITPFTLASLTRALERSGFAVTLATFGVTYSRVPEITDLDDRVGESLFIEGTK